MSELKPGLLPLRNREAKLPLGLLVRILLNNSKVLDTAATDYLLLDYLEVDSYLASLLEQLDPQEELIHIQRTAQNTGQELKLPRIWNKAAWTTSYERFLRCKEASEASRQAGYRRNEKIAELTAAIKRDTGLPDEFASVIARKIISEVSLQGAKTFGVDISDLPTTPISYFDYDLSL